MDKFIDSKKFEELISCIRCFSCDFCRDIEIREIERYGDRLDELDEIYGNDDHLLCQACYRLGLNQVDENYSETLPIRNFLLKYQVDSISDRCKKVFDERCNPLPCIAHMEYYNFPNELYDGEEIEGIKRFDRLGELLKE